MKKKLSVWLLTFAVLFAFSALSFAQETPGAGNTTATEMNSNTSAHKPNPGKKEKKHKKEKKPRKTKKQK